MGTSKHVERTPQKIELTYQNILNHTIDYALKARLLAIRRGEFTLFENAVINLWLILHTDTKKEVKKRIGCHPLKYINKAGIPKRRKSDHWIDEFTEEETDNREIYAARYLAATEVFETIMEVLHEQGWLVKTSDVLKGGE